MADVALSIRTSRRGARRTFDVLGKADRRPERARGSRGGHAMPGPRVVRATAAGIERRTTGVPVPLHRRRVILPAPSTVTAPGPDPTLEGPSLGCATPGRSTDLSPGSEPAGSRFLRVPAAQACAPCWCPTPAAPVLGACCFCRFSLAVVNAKSPTSRVEPFSEPRSRRAVFELFRARGPVGFAIRSNAQRERVVPAQCAAIGGVVDELGEDARNRSQQSR